MIRPYIIEFFFGGLMIKTIIFDLDNTLIKWEDEYSLAIDKILKKRNINFDYKLINDAIEESENILPIADKELLLKFINEKCNINLDIEFINELLEEQKQLVKINENLISTIDYLSKKYELIVLSNWFGYVQKERLKKAKIYNYFKEIYGGDIEYRKPDIRAFKRCIKNDIENYLMIGDSIDKDILPALSLGMKVILVSENKETKFKTIKKIEELKEML